MQSSSNIYQQRLLDQRYIRLLALQDDSFSCELRCTMHKTAFDSYGSPSYDAISYVWGSAADLRLIYCNDLPVNIPRSLRNALRLIWRKHPRLRLWADALCINQEDVFEKTFQVRIMGSIFETAGCVHVWLGDPTGFTKWSIRYIRFNAEYTQADHNVHDEEQTPLLSSMELRRKVAKLQRGLRSVSRRYFKRLRIGFNLALSHCCETIFKKIEPESPYWLSYWLISLRTRFAFHNSASTCHATIQEGLYDLAQRAWFRRAWTMQEILLAKHAILYCGKYEIEWSVWVRGLEALLGKQTFSSAFEDLLRETMVDMDLNTQSLSQLLTASWTRGATDPRDKLFSLLALMEDRTKILHLQPDYRLTKRQVYIIATRACIIDDGDLGILGAAGLNTEHRDMHALPSWVPDWENSKTRPIKFQVCHLARAWISQSRHERFGQRLDDLSNFLILRGTMIGQVKLAEQFASLTAMPPCASYAKPPNKAHTTLWSAKVNPTAFSLDAVMLALKLHEEERCPCVTSHAENSPTVTATFSLIRQSLPEPTIDGDLLCLMKGSQRLYIIRPSPRVVEHDFGRRRHKEGKKGRFDFGAQIAFRLVGEVHPSVNDRDAKILVQYFSERFSYSLDSRDSDTLFGWEHEQLLDLAKCCIEGDFVLI